MKSFLVGFKNILLWSYERGSWQYDLLCLLIVATIFLAPSHYFGDRDRTPETQANYHQAAASKSGESGTRQPETREINLEVSELQAFLARQNRAELMGSPREAIGLYLQDQQKREVNEFGYVPFTNAEGRLVYHTWFK